MVLFVVFGGGAAAGFVRGRALMSARVSERDSKARLAAPETELAGMQRLLSEPPGCKTRFDERKERRLAQPVRLAPTLRDHRGIPCLTRVEHFVR
jgi:hypothetical protein